jgi:hypothetical protein
MATWPAPPLSGGMCSNSTRAAQSIAFSGSLGVLTGRIGEKP